MRFRKLRIAWSIWWGLVAVLLIALWVRSYVQFDSVSKVGRQLSIASFRGRVFFNEDFYFDEPWDDGSTKVITLFRHAFLFDSYPAKHMASGGKCVAVPDWAICVSTLTIGMIPWIYWSRRFSLSTLLIATTLVAIALGAIVYATR